MTAPRQTATTLHGQHLIGFETSRQSRDSPFQAQGPATGAPSFYDATGGA